MKIRSHVFVLALGGLWGGCSGDAQDAPDAGGVARLPRLSAPGCTSPAEAPFRAEDGGHHCAPVGASTTAAANEWPDTTGAAEPVVYVRAESTGTGARDAPFGDLGAALRASPAARTVVLARGTHPLTATQSLNRTVTIVGAGPSDTRLVAPPAMSALAVQATASAVVVTLVGVSVRYEAPPSGASTPAALAVTGGQAHLQLREVVIEQPGRGVAVTEGATLCAERLTVIRATDTGVQLQAGAHAYLKNVAVRESGGAGVSAGRSHVVLDASFVASNRHDGVSIVGAVTGGACRTDAECAAAPACEGFLTGLSHARSCVALSATGATPSVCASVDELRDVVLRGNTVTGLRAQRARPTDAEVSAGMGGAVFAAPGPVVRASRVVVAGTRAPTDGSVGGDGVYVGPGATLSLDPGASPTAETRGRLSEIVANARVGLLVDGDAATDTTVPNANRVGARMDAQGASVVSNHGPGVFVQNRSSVGRFAFSVVGDNAAVGFGLTTGSSVAFFQDDQFIDTRAATLTLVTGTSTVRVTTGDGVSLANPAGEALFQDDQFIGNERVGLLVAGGTARLMGTNQGARNGYGVAALEDANLVGASTAIAGVVAVAPRTLAYLRDSLARVTDSR